MNNYIDGFVFPIAENHLKTYKKIAKKVADIWKEHGALAYNEFIEDEMSLEGIMSFTESFKTKKDEIIIFGYIVFPSKEIRDRANKKVANDNRMDELVKPLLIPNNLIFDASRMSYGGFKPFIIK